MTREEFERLVEEEFPNAIPEKFRSIIKNLVFLIEDEPDQATRAEEGLGPRETLLGLYRGIPMSARGEAYGIGGALPDTITLYQRPIEHEASSMTYHSKKSFEESVRNVIRETIWHEVAHHFGYNEEQVREREERDGIL